MIWLLIKKVQANVPDIMNDIIHSYGKIRVEVNNKAHSGVNTLIIHLSVNLNPQEQIQRIYFIKKLKRMLLDSDIELSNYYVGNYKRTVAVRVNF